MELLMQEVKAHSDDRQLEEEDEEDEIEEEETETTKLKFHTLHPYHQEEEEEETQITKLKFQTLHPHHQNQDSWLGLHDRHSPDATTTTDSHNSSCGLGFRSSNFSSKPELMDLSLGIENRDINEEEEGTAANENDVVLTIEKEHMFDKVVTPSDVGKLNRLVIPKQHAEKYFPLDSSTNEKGLLLNFEDRNGKLWRFRYSYWNSSQSYVMTKGWSRFVKEKKLDAGDIVSFQRGAGEAHRHRLYIDYRRRPDHGPDPALITPFLLHQPSQFSVRWGGRLYSLPSLPPPPLPPRATQLNYSNMFPFHQQQQQQPHQYNEQYLHHHHNHHPWHNYNAMSSGSGSVYQNLIGQQQEGGTSGNGNGDVPMIINSVPVDHYYHQRNLRYHQPHSSTNTKTTTTTGKTLRLFGVNMECDTTASSSSSSMANSSSTSSLSSSSSIIPPPLHQYLRVPHEDPRFQNHHHHRQKGEASMLFDLDPSLQYRH